MKHEAGGVTEMWRCRDCGKWSHARRRPAKHKRWVNTGAADTDYGHVDYGHFVWCGPFDRYEARHSDHYSPPALAALGEVAPDSTNNDDTSGISAASEFPEAVAF